MIGWLRRLSPAFRHSIYFFGVIVAFFLAVGVGAAIMVVAGWQFGRVATGSGEMSALESAGVETTGSGGASEPTRVERSGDSKDSNDSVDETSFVHRADPENSRGDYTFIKNTNIDGDANAVVLVLSAAPPVDSGAARYGHNIGVWFEPVAQRWAIFNQDRSPIPEGATFEVVIPQASEGFVHRAEPSDTAGNATYLSGPRTNGNPDAAISVTQNWNPGGGEGIYNDHPADLFYDTDVEQWAILNRDGESIPEGAAFNVAVSAGSGESTK